MLIISINLAIQVNLEVTLYDPLVSILQIVPIRAFFYKTIGSIRALYTLSIQRLLLISTFLKPASLLKLVLQYSSNIKSRSFRSLEPFLTLTRIIIVKFSGIVIFLVISTFTSVLFPLAIIIIDTLIPLQALITIHLLVASIIIFSSVITSIPISILA